MGSSGGGSSGAVSHSAYLENIHSDWLSNGGADSITSSVTDIMNAALGNSPWTGLAAYDPSTDITAYETVLTAFKTILSGIVDTTDWASLYTQALASIGAYNPLVIPDMVATTITNATITASSTAHADLIDDEMTTKVLPRFRRGMQDINAVVSSAFPIGEAIIEAFRDRDVAEYDAKLRLEAEIKNAEINTEVRKINILKNLDLWKGNKQDYLTASGQMLQLMMNRIGWEEGYAKSFIESKRIKIVAKKEQTDQDAKIDEEDALWDLEVFQFGANVMAGIQGGTSGARAKQPSMLQSMIGGALSGAASGAMIGSAIPGVGTAIGAGIGGVLGLASGFL
jgi:hypothetical protein